MSASSVSLTLTANVLGASETGRGQPRARQADHATAVIPPIKDTHLRTVLARWRFPPPTACLASGAHFAPVGQRSK